ncbi:hypothetical protein GQ53DRAFT_741534 [Thozetella sp. PMI_491]|nr:hypothetical protein GQ53DRAFT_741534 [Thozetella sp. PMI_491]
MCYTTPARSVTGIVKLASFLSVSHSLSAYLPFRRSKQGYCTRSIRAKIAHDTLLHSSRSCKRTNRNAGPSQATRSA